MNQHLVSLSLNYRTTPVEVRERLAFAENKASEAAQEIRSLPGFEESLVLSTCNRVELYATHGHEDGKIGHVMMRDYLVKHFEL